MEISFDEDKRQKTILDGALLTLSDDRFPYPESRFQTYGVLNERMVMFAWTHTDRGIRVISMRRCNEREQRKFAARLG
jgi:hypothetical protein